MRNTFRFINGVSKKKFNNFYGESVNVTTEEESEFGFYQIFANQILDVYDQEIIEEMIIDDTYNSKVLGQKNEDKGIDLVYIDDVEKKIKFAAFKYKHNFTVNGKENDIAITNKFFSRIDSENLDNLTPKTKKVIEEVLNRNGYDYELYYVTNARKNNDTGLSEYIQSLNEISGLETIVIGLEDWKNLIFNDDVSNQLNFVVPTSNLFLFKKTELSSESSLVMHLSLEEVSKLIISEQDIKTEYLSSNVREYLGEKNKYNKNIKKTIENDPDNFMFYNNGITVVCENLKTEPKDGSKNLDVKITNYQVVNGGQTLMTLANVFLSLETEEQKQKFNNLKVLVRMYTTSNEEQISKISEYTNSQTPIADKDLKSVDRVQIDLEKYLKEHGVNYIRKAGINRDAENFDKEIALDELAQVLYSRTNPSIVTSNKQKLFKDLYDEIFNESLDFEVVKRAIDEYFEIINKYDQIGIAKTKLKVFYCIYIIKKEQKSIEDSIKYLEEVIEEYSTENEIDDSRARILTQKKFFEKINGN